LKVNIVTTCKKNCGISIYSDYLFKELKKKINVHIIENTEENFSQIAEKAKQADIVHVQFEPGSFGSTLMLKGTSIPEFYKKLSQPKKTKIITTIHEMNESSIKGTKSFFIHFFQKIINSHVLQNSDLIIVHSRKLEQFAKKYAKNVVFLPHGTMLSQKAISNAVAKKKLNLQGKTILTIFGFVEPRKQHAKIIELLPELDEKIVLLIAGKSVTSEKYFEELKQLVKQKNLEKRVIFYGFVEDKDKKTIFSATDLMLYPYKDIYQSGSMNEVLSFEKPVLASSIDGFKEFQKEFHCIELAEEHEWTHKINKLLKDKKIQKVLAKKAKTYCRENSWKHIAERTIKEYEKLLK
ncbi:MAG: glycosyltransferase, partial [Candidatus Diapherotrites archaeon]|nr:glycosyltransferase [Candidatus Diapherotrites archaeon]